MNRKANKFLSVFVVMVMLSVLLMACQGKKESPEQSADTGKKPESGQKAEAGQTGKESEGASGTETSQLKPVTLKVMLWGDKPKQFDDVVAEFEKQTKDTLNVHLDVTWTPQADYVNKLKLKLSAGEQVDAAFDAPWMNMNQFIQQDNYFNLDDYFFNDKYPGLKKAFSEAYLNNNKFMGNDQKLHVYGIPLGQYYQDLGIIYYRKDLADKYGMPDIESYDDLLKYYDTVLKNEPNMIPFVEKNDGTYTAAAAIDGEKAKAVAAAEKGIWAIPIAPDFDASAYIKDNKVVAIALPGESIEAKAQFPEPFNKEDYSTETAVREWHDKKYTEKEPITRKDAESTFTTGKAASMTETIANFPRIQAELKAAVSNGELGMFLVDKGEREKRKHYMITDFRVWNFLAVPKSSPNLDRVMLFFNWLFDNQDNHDLFELGIPGKNWVAVGNDKFKYPDGIDVSQNYNLPGYVLTWNPNYIRLPEIVPDKFVQYYRYLADDESYLKSAIAGFVFNGDPVKNALANPDLGKMSSDKLPIRLGMIDNPADALAKLQSKWESNKALQSDLKAIKDELTKQLQAFLDAQ